jgi:hypothetical protein
MDVNMHFHTLSKELILKLFSRLRDYEKHFMDTSGRRRLNYNRNDMVMA